MKKATQINEVKPARRKPDFSGVPGELVAVDAIPADVVFGNKRQSPYDALLLKLKENPMQALRFGDVKAQASIHARSRKLGIAVETAEHEGQLYVRMKELHGAKAQARRDRITSLLKQGVALTAPALAAKLREQGDAVADGQLVLVILEQMARSGEVIKQEGGTWIGRRKSAA